MAEEKPESGQKRQDRIQREQHRPEQNAGYDEAVRGGPPLPDAVEDSDQVSSQPAGAAADQDLTGADDPDSRGAAAEVRRRERSAD